jgi:uncharacterized protein YcbK (DUF882 family)
MQLSPHFSLAELTISQAASRRGIKNVPNADALAALKSLCVNVLEPIRAHFDRPVIISSGYRAPAVNKAVGGSATSAHCFGQAADFTVPGVSNFELCGWIERNLNYDQLIYEFGESGWVHVGYGGKMRNMELSAKTVSRRTKYLPGIVK